MEFCRAKGLDEDALFELGLLRRGDDGHIYAMFRHRIMIPIRNRWGRIIAYTARYIGNNPKAPKYINSPNSAVYAKGECPFGIDRASRERNAEYIIIVEGAPDVLRMQSVGYDNTVAALGTAWTDSQFERLKKYTSSLCFIPDSDVSEGKPFGPGFEAVMANGTAAVRKGFHVTVRELPFAEIPVGGSGWDVKPGKNDADSFIHSREDYTSLKEKLFIVWLAQKRFLVADSLVEERKCVSEIADLMRYVKDQLIFNQCIDELARIYGKAKLWRDAVTQARGEARKRQDKLTPMDERQREAELLRQHGLFIRENCYYATGDDDEEPSRISNFIMEPLFHIEDENNGTRIFRMRNTYNICRVIELRESELCSLNSFQQKVGSVGNYVWLAKIDKLNRVKEYLYSQTDTAERVRKLGWNAAEGFFAFGNGIFADGTFRNVNDLGIVRGVNGKAYYIPAMSKIYIHNPEIFQFVAFCYLLSTLFRDIVFKRTRHFPILNLFGEKGTGKTTLATSLQAFFLHGVDPPNLGVTSVPAMNDRVSQAVNTLVVLDEYKNDLDIRKIAYLKGAFSKTSFSQKEKSRYEDLVALCNLGLTHLTIEILNHRELFEKNFADTYSIVKRELAAKMEDETIHDRIFGNWVIPLATFRTLETVLDVPFNYTDLFDTAVKGMRVQNELAQESSEVADFWNMLQGFQTMGKCVEKAHYRIRYLKSFRPLAAKEEIEFMEARPILYLNMAAVASLFNSRNQNTTANRSNWSTIMSYLKSHPSFLGLKQDRFTILLPNGMPDYTIEMVGNEQVKKVKVNRPKALCFDYLQLKETFGLELEMEVVADTEVLDIESDKPNINADELPQGELPF